MAQSKHFTSKLVQHFRVGLNKTRLAVITYDTEPNLEWDLRDTISNEETKKKINEINFNNGTLTNTGKKKYSTKEYQYYINYLNRISYGKQFLPLLIRKSSHICRRSSTTQRLWWGSLRCS